MNDRQARKPEDTAAPVGTDGAAPADAERARIVEQLRLERRETRRWWIKLVVQPLLLVALLALLIVGLGVCQRLGWISADSGSSDKQLSMGGENTRYICPMMCTPAQLEPGRCPVCAMELVATTSLSASGSLSIGMPASSSAGLVFMAVRDYACSTCNPGPCRNGSGRVLRLSGCQCRRPARRPG